MVAGLDRKLHHPAFVGIPPLSHVPFLIAVTVDSVQFTAVSRATLPTASALMPVEMKERDIMVTVAVIPERELRVMQCCGERAG